MLYNPNRDDQHKVKRKSFHTQNHWGKEKLLIEWIKEFLLSSSLEYFSFCIKMKILWILIAYQSQDFFPIPIKNGTSRQKEWCSHQPWETKGKRTLRASQWTSNASLTSHSIWWWGVRDDKELRCIFRDDVSQSNLLQSWCNDKRYKRILAPPTRFIKSQLAMDENLIFKLIFESPVIVCPSG